VFEDRVARALSKLGVYTQNDVQRLAMRVDELAEAVNKLLKTSGAKGAKASPKAAPTKKRAAKTGPAKGKNRGKARGATTG